MAFSVRLPGDGRRVRALELRVADAGFVEPEQKPQQVCVFGIVLVEVVEVVEAAARVEAGPWARRVAPVERSVEQGGEARVRCEPEGVGNEPGQRIVRRVSSLPEPLRRETDELVVERRDRLEVARERAQLRGRAEIELHALVHVERAAEVVRRDPESTRLRAALVDLLADRVAFDVPLARHTALRIGGPAEAIVTPADRDELARALALCHAHGCPTRVLGSGFNMLVADEGLPGVVIGCAIYRGDQEMMSGIATHMSDEFEPPADRGHWTIRLDLPKIRLLHGEYKLVGYVADERGLHIYHSNSMTGRFHLQQKTKYMGVALLEHQWSARRRHGSKAEVHEEPAGSAGRSGGSANDDG